MFTPLTWKPVNGIAINSPPASKDYFNFHANNKTRL